MKKGELKAKVVAVMQNAEERGNAFLPDTGITNKISKDEGVSYRELLPKVRAILTRLVNEEKAVTDGTQNLSYGQAVGYYSLI